MLQRSPFGADDFGYSYFSGTNRLQAVSNGLTNHSYTYDANGNMLSDQLNRTGSIKYDHRNLMTEIRVIKSEAPSIFEPPVDVLYLTQYRYDEAGNRVRKVRYKYTGSEPDPVFDVSGDAPPWTMQSDEFYVRDVSGKEIAIYSGSGLAQWNIWGLDNVGKINSDTTRNYYLKDHLGSVRVVLNSVNSVVSAQDYDAWGYPLENRTYNSSAMRYDFTGKERDDETSYDYFGARYYDSRIGRWGQVEPLLDIYLSFSPYIYIFDNPTNIVDVDGRGPDEDIQPSETQILESGTDIMGGKIEIGIYIDPFKIGQGVIGTYLLQNALSEDEETSNKADKEEKIEKNENDKSKKDKKEKSKKKDEHSGKIRKLSDKEAKKIAKEKFGVDVHELKKIYLGDKAKISRFNLYKDETNNQYILRSNDNKININIDFP